MNAYSRFSLSAFPYGYTECDPTMKTVVHEKKRVLLAHSVQLAVHIYI